MTRKQRVTRAVYGVYVVLVAAFVFSCIFQIARQVFSAPETHADLADARLPKVGQACGEKMMAAIRAIDMARLAASTETEGEAARARYTKERAAVGTGELERACSADETGPAALAAVSRLDRAAEAHAVRDAAELSPVRLGAQSFIRGPR